MINLSRIKERTREAPLTSQAGASSIDPTPEREARTLRPVGVDAAADAARILVALHERVERQLEAYEAAEGSHAVRRRAVAAMAAALATHVAVEDELLYPAGPTPAATAPRSSASSSRTTCSTWSWSSWGACSRPTGATTAKSGP